MKNIKYIALGLAIGLVFSCGNKNTSDASGEVQLEGSVSIDGSSTVYPITEAVAEEYRAAQPKVRVTVGLSGTGGGFKKFGRGETDINNASRSITAREDSMCKVSGIDYVELMVAYDGLAVVVNPQNTWCKDITVEELKKIWEPAAQEKIKRWNQVRAEWPNEEIHLYGAGVESGTYDYFTEVIVGKSHSSRGDFTGSEDDNILVQGISGDKFALGFFGLAYFEENSDKLKLIPVDDGNDDNGAGAILPSLETVKNKTYSPLSRPLFIYPNSNAKNKKEIADFVEFYLDIAGELTKEVGYIPLNDDEYKQQKENFKRFVEGK